MTIAPEILHHFPDLNEAQRAVIGHAEGPLLVIAGPGSGKTYSMVLRTLNLLLLNKVMPKNIVLCTFTEKAAFELRDRLSSAALKVGYKNDLSELRASTIHGLCNSILNNHRHHSPLGHNYETLDDLTQLLFLHEHFNEIIGPQIGDRYLTRWRTRWSAIEGARSYFDKITEELIDPENLINSNDTWIVALGEAYQNYRKILFDHNRVDFAHLQWLVHDLLANPEVATSILREIEYILVDEYQDTNFIQEQLLLQLSGRTKHLCVVGDEDQSLYRFRGATVRNILEFPSRVKDCQEVQLTTSYRSHCNIIDKYDRWMASADWSNPDGTSFRFNKKISPDPNGEHPEYPAVFAIWGKNRRDEAQRFADFVKFLKDEKVIEDYNQVALLLHSVRQDHSSHYIDALSANGISAFCPRARAYFENEEIKHIVASLALIFGWYGDGRGQVSGSVANLATYVDEALINLGRRFASPHPLSKALSKWTREIAGLKDGESLDFRPADYFYNLLAIEPFSSAVKNENAARNLAIFSQLLNTFQNYYHYTVITYRNREFLRLNFFNSFLRLLFEGGINEYEDPDQPFPKGYVQIMTIHQAKGLEFPIVVVDSLSAQLSSPKRIDRDLRQFYHRLPFEPESRITNFDRMRLHYVAFSRPQKVLVLSASSLPKDHFSNIWDGLPQWPYVKKDLLAAQSFSLRDRMPVKRSYSFTGDLKIYETCPRQFQFYRDYDFTPSRSAVIFFGLLVHQTIEEVHRIAIDGKLDTLNQSKIKELFERSFRFLAMSDVRPIGQAAKKTALEQVMNYFHQNQDDMKRVVQTEVDVSLEKEGYILSGKVDLLMGGDGELELLDFKTSPRPKENPKLITAYERQLCTYAHILENRYGHKVNRLMLYWTSEPRKKDALMVLPYNSEKVEEAGRYFDEVVGLIQRREFAVKKSPGSSICKECDIRQLCISEGLLQ